MEKGIEILGIQLDNDTVADAMLRVDEYLNNTVMNTIGSVTMEMLMLAKDDETLRESLENLDLAMISDKEILKAAGVDSPKRQKETVEQQFFTEFMDKVIANQNTLYLFGETRQQLEELESFLREGYPNLCILGGFAMEDCVGDYDGAVNEINISSPDIIFSVLPTPEQEYFLTENKEKMNAKIWYGLGNGYGKNRGVSSIKGMVKKMIHKEMLRSMLSKYEQEK